MQTRLENIPMAKNLTQNGVGACDDGMNGDNAVLDESGIAAKPNTVHDWALRGTRVNDFFLVSTFNNLVETSAALPPAQRVVMYDACDKHEVSAPVGTFRRRLDARRNSKPKKPNAQLLVCTPFDSGDFNFSKIQDARERVATLRMKSGMYELLTNKFPLFSSHMLLVAQELVPQQMSRVHLEAVGELVEACSCCAYFNSWCASASVNHFHCHLIGEKPPVTKLPLVSGPLVAGARCLVPEGFPGFCYVFEANQLVLVAELVSAMQSDNQPHNLLFTGRHVYVWPKPHSRPQRSFDLYPETVGGPELCGSFTVYNHDDYAALSLSALEEATRINTAPLPSRVLQRGGAAGVDDAAVHASVCRTAKEVLASRSLNYLPSLPPPEQPVQEPWAKESGQEPWTIRAC